ncbi:MAG: hypothetical protein GY899_03565, partial [Verrucomicrobiaceae bacterium]|nr:hypothetical protein [Verrucomicrobiaceae bacterium]
MVTEIRSDLVVERDARFDSEVNIQGDTSLNGNLAINTDKFTVTAATGNVAVAGTANVTGAATFSGPVMIADNATVQQDLDVAGRINAERLYLNGPGGETRFDGEINRISGLMTEIRSDLLVERDAFFGGEVRLDGPMTRIRGDLLVEHNAFFDGEVRLVGPITEPKHATSKEYVDDRYIENRVRIDQARADSLDQYDDNRQRIDHARDESHALHHENRVRIDQARTDSLDQYDDNRQRIEAAQQSLQAKPAARVAALANVDLQNASPEIDGVTLAAGDRVLLAGQANAAENG